MRGFWPFSVLTLLSLMPNFARAQPTQSAFVHLFQWRWLDVAQECESYLGPHGFRAVIVSPPSEHAVIDGNPWYESYQPVSYRLESRGGTGSDFIEMVSRCRRAGVEVYVDAVINHMAYVVPPGRTAFGFAGTPYTHYRFGDLYQPQDFHRCGRHGDDSIKNYRDRWEVQNCNLLGLADLNTGADTVREKIANYLNDLVAIGVRGFRIDAAKHIDASELGLILKKIKGRPYIFQEVAEAEDEPIKAREYFKNGAVTEFRYGSQLSSIFKSGDLSRLARFGQNFMPSERAVVFVDNHDTQRDSPVLTYKNKGRYLLANVFMLAWPYGYPMLMSSYDFTDFNQGPPGLGWIKEHRWPQIAQMVKFRKSAGKSPVENFWTGERGQIAFSRGSLGFVVINIENNSLEHRFQTGLPEGTYEDILSKKQNRISVDALGYSTIVVPAHSAVALSRI